MAYKIIIRPLAALEIVEAYDWYESRQEGLGLKFLEELDTLYTKLLDNPNIYGYFEKPVREGKLSRFPYTIVYEVIDETIVVYSVFMAKQNPSNKRTG
jgi:hypothetical protein